MPLMIARGRPSAADIDLARSLLNEVGMDAFADRKSDQLSGGQQQRVAIARALVARPALLLADEPTGNLDPDTALLVMDALLGQTRAQGASLVLVTHSQAAATRADRILRLSADGIRP
jgi:putative ABC transport system ATP-binding protein